MLLRFLKFLLQKFDKAGETVIVVPPVVITNKIVQMKTIETHLIALTGFLKTAVTAADKKELITVALNIATMAITNPIELAFATFCINEIAKTIAA